jgi:hypothetical protein
VGKSPVMTFRITNRFIILSFLFTRHPPSMLHSKHGNQAPLSPSFHRSRSRAVITATEDIFTKGPTWPTATHHVQKQECRLGDDRAGSRSANGFVPKSHVRKCSRKGKTSDMCFTPSHPGRGQLLINRWLMHWRTIVAS